MGIRKGHAVMLLLVVATVAGCARIDNLGRKKGVLFDGHQFRTRVEKTADAGEEFQVTVFRASQSVEGARQAGAYEAVRYCIQQFGSSDATWTVGPDSEGLTVVDDTLTFQGRCKGW